MSTLHCARCGRDSEAMSRPPMPGPLGREIQAKICPACWAEWQKQEVMVINELRLNFMDPEAQKVLSQHLRQFLLLEGQP